MSSLFFFEGGCIELDRIKTNDEEWIINNPPKEVQPLYKINIITIIEYH